MHSEAVMQRVLRCGIVPAVRTTSPSDAARAAEAIAAGGIDTLEIPVTVPGVLDVIQQLRRDHPELIIGAGTVLDEVTARTAILAGAQFIVSPSLDLDVIRCCKRYSIAVMPGALTPSEIVAAWQAGADMVKVFPASAMGGAGYIRALLAPLPQIRLMPMGGVSTETAAGYLAAGASALGIGSDLVDTVALAVSEDHRLTEKARVYVNAVAVARSASVN